jgi:hypothetical protein
MGFARTRLPPKTCGTGHLTLQDRPVKELRLEGPASPRQCLHIALRGDLQRTLRQGSSGCLRGTHIPVVILGRSPFPQIGNRLGRTPKLLERRVAFFADLFPG